METTLIERYIDYRQFIIEALAALGRTRRELAQHLGISDSMMSQILSGVRKLRPDQVDAVADFFELGPEGRHYLAALVDSENESPRAQRLAWSTIQAHQRRRLAEQPSEEASAVLARWYVGAIHELAGCDGFQPNAAWIAATLNPPISEAQADEAIGWLLAHGLLEPDEEQGLRRARADQITAPDAARGTQSAAAASLQRQLAELAERSLEEDDPRERHLSTMIFALPEERWQELRTRLREIESELLHVAVSPGPTPPNRVYMLGIQLFPVSLFSDTEYDPVAVRKEESD